MQIKRYAMTCGHSVLVDDPKVPAVCPRCNCGDIAFPIYSVTDRLENRYAVCGERRVRSRWDLPGFVYRPDEETDTYFFGQKKRALSNGTLMKVTEEDDRNLHSERRLKLKAKSRKRIIKMLEDNLRKQGIDPDEL